MLKAGLIGAGKMGISHFAILGAHPDVEVSAVCDSASFITSPLKKHTHVETFKDYKDMIKRSSLDFVVVATPTSSHFETAKYALEQNLHVFVEKPLCLTPQESKTLADLAKAQKRISQVGYHNRFIGTFIEAARLVRSGALGDVYHINGSAFGQVVVKKKADSTWRSKKSEGGGCLHDYCSHVIDLMNFVMGPPKAVLGAKLQSIFSESIEDAVYATLVYPNGASGQIETNWSDESYRKMSTSITVYGTAGKLQADRQELKVYLRKGAEIPGYGLGWTMRYITDLQKPVWYYLRGEEYSAQLDSFIQSIKAGQQQGDYSFASAYETDRVVDLIQQASRS
ncbi:MAG: Gfo/Idh/MocA family oxidoreductase [Polyangiaceae bacterium]